MRGRRCGDGYAAARLRFDCSSSAFSDTAPTWRSASRSAPPGFAFEWTDLTYQEFIAGIPVSGDPAGVPGAAALYGSLTLPLSIIMDVLPLVLSIGAGSEMRRAMGVAVFSGMIGVTIFSLFLTPVFYVLPRSVTGMKPLTQHGEATIPNKAHAA